MIRELRSFWEQWNAIQMELRDLPEEPRQPQLPRPFTGMDVAAAREMARKDSKQFAAASGSKIPVVLIPLSFLGFIAAAALCMLRVYAFAGLAGAAGLAALLWGIREKISQKKNCKELLEKYGHGYWKSWADPIGIYEKELLIYWDARNQYQEIRSDLEVRLLVLRKKRESLCIDGDVDAQLAYWEQIQKNREAYSNICREVSRTENHYETLKSMVRPAEKPAMPDTLTQSAEETARLMTECAMEQQRLQNRLGQYQGRMELLGNRETAQKQLDQVNGRINSLEETFGALTIALDTLAAARAQLQRRFAPRITRQAEKMLSQMTDGRYHSLAMGEDFSLRAGAGQEETLHDALWRSDGTMDQLYLSLRLAVAEELTPNVPLILDDALVRFDDQRMGSAVEILKEMARTRQVICFTCQGREAQI